MRVIEKKDLLDRVERLEKSCVDLQVSLSMTPYEYSTISDSIRRDIVDVICGEAKVVEALPVERKENEREIESAEILDRIDVLEIKGKLQASLEFTEMLCFILREFVALLSGEAKIIETIPMQEKENAD